MWRSIQNNCLVLMDYEKSIIGERGKIRRRRDRRTLTADDINDNNGV